MDSRSTDRSATQGLTSRVVPAHAISELELAVWRRLCREHSHLSHPFFSGDYAKAVALTRAHVYVCIVMQDGCPIGFLPFQFRSRLHKVLQAAERVGEEMTDYFGLIAEPGLVIEPRKLLQLAGLSHLYFTHLHDAQFSYGLVGERPDPSLLTRLDGQGGSYWMRLRETDKEFVAATERKQRQLQAAYGPLRFCWAEENWAQALEHLIEHKRRQYARTGGGDALAAAWKRKLMRLLAASTSEDCRGVVTTLHAGDTWVASHFGLRNQHLLHYWFPAYNFDLSRYSPGRLLLKIMIERAGEANIDIIDWGAGESRAKRDFANASHLCYRGAWHRPSPQALAYRVGCSIKWRLDAARLRSSRPGEGANSQPPPPPQAHKDEVLAKNHSVS